MIRDKERDSIDLNADLGEGCDGDEGLMAIVSSCNIACGGHAGDERSMEAAISLALQNNVSIGAHPSYPDRENFGRSRSGVTSTQLKNVIEDQLRSFIEILIASGGVLHHIKPHGALYNEMADQAELAMLFCEIVSGIAPGTLLYGLPTETMETMTDRYGLKLVAEGFADRAYTQTARLSPRSQAGSVIEDHNRQTRQAIALATGTPFDSINGFNVVQKVDSICVHGDHADALNAAKSIRDSLAQSGITIMAPNV